jgi:hypothetical protein
MDRPSIGPRIGSPGAEPPAARPRIESFERREIPDAARPGGGLGERPAVTPQLETPRGANPRPAPRMNLPSTDVPSPRIEAPGASPRIAPPRAGAGGPRIDRTPSVRPNVSSSRPSISRGNSSSRGGGPSPSISRGRSGGGPPANRGGGGRGRGGDRDD